MTIEKSCENWDVSHISIYTVHTCVFTQEAFTHAQAFKSFGELSVKACISKPNWRLA